MGSHSNYPMIIENLILLKGEFHLITEAKYQGLIEVLKKYEVVPYSDNDNIPDHTELAKTLNYSQGKTNSLIKGLLSRLLNTFNEHPLCIRNVVHFLQILPYSFPEEKFKDWHSKEWDKSVFIRTVLPVTPRIGEYIDLDFTRTISGFDTELPYNGGYVHDVRHKITGTTQEIIIEIYPFRSIYYKWMDLKGDYETSMRWRARIKNQ